MSEKYPTIHEQHQLMHPCPTCYAQPGEWCRTKRGGIATFVHVPRGVTE